MKRAQEKVITRAILSGRTLTPALSRGEREHGQHDQRKITRATLSGRTLTPALSRGEREHVSRPTSGGVEIRA
jgi:hypothetical protein